jgi:hypothetical protein
MGNPPLHPNNKVYTLTPKFIKNLRGYFRKLKLRWYKKKKVNESKTPHQRYYYMNFKIHVQDELNPQVSDLNYSMVVPAKAAYFAKLKLEQAIKEKLRVEVVDWEEMTEEEHSEYLQSQEDYEKEQVRRALSK